MNKAFAYLRTSSATNVGADKDSDKRQRAAIEACAAKLGYQIVGEYYDADVRGADPINARPAFAELLAEIAGDGVRTIIVETASRFSRDLITQEVGFQHLRALDIQLIAADSPQAFLDEGPTAVLVRQILGAVAQFQKAELVAKLAAARARKRVANGRCDGRKPAPEAARLRAKELHARGWSLRKIAADLAEQGFLSPSGQAYQPGSIKVMLK